MRLDVEMSRSQYCTGFAERIARLLRAGTFCALRGRWRVRRQLALYDRRSELRDMRRVTYALEPLDTVARDVLNRQAH